MTTSQKSNNGTSGNNGKNHDGPAEAPMPTERDLTDLEREFYRAIPLGQLEGVMQRRMMIRAEAAVDEMLPDAVNHPEHHDEPGRAAGTLHEGQEVRFPNPGSS